MERTVVYKILYKNGKEDVIKQSVSEDSADDLAEVNRIINLSMKEGVNAVITFGDGVSQGYFIRVSDITRVETSFEVSEP